MLTQVRSWIEPQRVFLLLDPPPGMDSATAATVDATATEIVSYTHKAPNTVGYYEP